MSLKMRYVIGLILMGGSVFGSVGWYPATAKEEGPISAEAACSLSKAGGSDTYKKQYDELLSDVYAAIRNSAHEGLYYASVRVDEYRTDVQYAIMKELKREGFTVKLSAPYETYVSDLIITIEWGKGVDAEK